MSIPSNITKGHLLQAIKKIDEEGYDHHGEPMYYDLIHDGKRYPPKLIVSYANLFANGEILDRNSFEGGLGTLCFKLLEENGFQIINKEEAGPISFFDELIKFLDQVKSGELGALTYQKEYSTLKVKVSLDKETKLEFLGLHF
jgi:5-methylcytosine-specific restriction protein B